MPGKKLESVSDLYKKNAKAMADWERWKEETRKAREAAEIRSLLAVEKERIEREKKWHQQMVERATKKKA